MFIPINAKADVQGSKKGKLTPAQNAQLNAWCLASKTGILNCLNKCQSTLSTYTATNNVANVIFKKGYIVICGRLIECEEGTEVPIQTPATGSISGKIILRYNLSNSGENEFVITTKTGDLIQQDLNDNPLTGIYEFELYSYTATPATVTLTRNISYIPDIGGKLQELINGLTNGNTIVKKAKDYDTSSGTIKQKFGNIIDNSNSPLYQYNNSKGTIESRLTNLGFKTGTITKSSSPYVTISNSTLTKLGNYVIGQFDVHCGDTNIGTIPEGFRPYTDKTINTYIRSLVSGGYQYNYNPITMTFKTNGQIVTSMSNVSDDTKTIMFGWDTTAGNY